MGESLTFVTLGGDILAIVIRLLYYDSPWSLKNLSLVSRFCKELVDPSLYRSIELNEADPSTKRKIQRLTDPSDSIVRHVRELSVTGYTGRDCAFGASEFDTILGHLFRLQVFSWESTIDPPQSTISKLEQYFPGAKLIVCSHESKISDTRPLFSPQLHALTFHILNEQPRREVQEQQSRLPELRNVLLNNTKLRVLDIRTQSNFSRGMRGPGDHTKFRSMNLPLQPSDRFPPLHELRFSGSATYEFELSYAKLWSQCMDWSQLRTLDLGISCPQHFFEEIGSQLIGLRSLTMGIGTGPRNYVVWKFGPMTCDTLQPASQFIASLSGLQELHITDLDAAAEKIVPTIVQTQTSLQVLSYHTSMHRRLEPKMLPCTWTTAQLDELQQRAPNISGLSIDLPLEDGKWPSDHAATLVRSNHLSSVRINAKLNSDAFESVAEYYQNAWDNVPTRRLHKRVGLELVTGLFKSFFMYDAYAYLTELKVYFIFEEGYDRYDGTNFPIIIRRLGGKHGPGLADGDFIAHCLWFN